ncbi:MAG: PucR family transcriptional regulator [Firmicutes bacterium]|nr:PucR family transcriptional regulator [Bacillota bacterium]
MSISIFDATKLKTFQNFKLISGVSGLDRMIHKVGILDWEFFHRIPGHFVTGEFVLTSLLFAKDHPEYIYEAVKDLINDGVSGLAVKNIYYDELPKEVVQLSNEIGFPIFIFDNSAYFEDIITEVMDRIRLVNHYELIEAKIDILLNKSLDRSTVKELALELNPRFKEQCYAVFFTKRQYHSDIELNLLLNTIKQHPLFEKESLAVRFRNGVMMIFTGERLNVKSHSSKTLSRFDLDSGHYHIGVSNMYQQISEIDKLLKESAMAHRIACIEGENVMHFDDVGVYSLLLPYHDDFWMRRFHQTIIQPLKGYDQAYHSGLYDTAIAYVEADGDIRMTAQSLFIHQNTVRYRLSKIKEILNFHEGDVPLFAQLSIAVKLDRLYGQ